AIRDDIAAGRKLVPPSRRPSPDLSEEDIRGGPKKPSRDTHTDAPAAKPVKDTTPYLKSKDDAGNDVIESRDHKIKITTLSNGDTITEFADGKEKEFYEWPNGNTETTYRGGDKKSAHYDAASGATVTEFSNGDKKIEHKDGTIEAEFAEGEIKKQIHFAEPKVTRTVFRDGPVVSEDALPDGTIMKVMKDHSHVVEKTNGTTTEIKEDGTLTVRDKTG